MSGPLKAAIWLGGIALLAATAIDTLAVIGRHLGIPVTGSIELMQAAVLECRGTVSGRSRSSVQATRNVPGLSRRFKRRYWCNWVRNRGTGSLMSS